MSGVHQVDQSPEPDIRDGRPLAGSAGIPDCGSDSASGSDPRADPGAGEAALPRVRTESSWTRLWRPFWALPLLICLTAWLAALALPVLDESLQGRQPYLFQAGPDGARNLLGTIATAMISVTGLVFSITMVVLQLASSQFTPRVLTTFLQSRITQATLGVFAASFIYALTVLRVVRADYEIDEPFVPQWSVTVAFALVVVSVGLFLAFIHHITTSIQVSRIISRVGDETVQAIRDLYPDADAPTPAPSWTAPAGTPSVTVSTGPAHGQVSQIDHRCLLRFAKDRDVVVELLVPVGVHLPEDAPMVRVWQVDQLDEEATKLIRKTVTLADDRAPHQDPGFGVRRLVDIADRALSPGINDPTTASQVLDELARILRVLVRRASPTACLAQDGVVRLLHRPQLANELVALAFDEISHYGRDSVQMPRRLVAIVRDLIEVSLPQHRPMLQRRLELLTKSDDDPGSGS